MRERERQRGRRGVEREKERGRETVSSLPGVKLIN